MRLNRLPILHRPLIMLAWLFIAGTLVHHLGQANGQPANALASVLGLGVIVFATVQPIALLRTAGHLALVAWSAIWFGDSLAGVVTEPSGAMVLTTSLLGAAGLATAYRGLVSTRGRTPFHDAVGAPDAAEPTYQTDEEASCPDGTPALSDTRCVRLRAWVDQHIPSQESKRQARARVEHLKCSAGERCDHMRQLANRARCWSNRTRARLANVIAPGEKRSADSHAA